MQGELEDLMDVVVDVSQLVKEQGEELDVVEANVESADGQVKEGVVQLREAASLSIAARKKICIIVRILVVVTAIILIYYCGVKGGCGGGKGGGDGNGGGNNNNRRGDFLDMFNNNHDNYR